MTAESLGMYLLTYGVIFGTVIVAIVGALAILSRGLRRDGKSQERPN